MASRYNLVEYDSEEERLRDPEGPPTRNLIAAGNYITRILDANRIDWAVMGGFAMICRGSRRPTRDVDIVTATTMGVLWTVIEVQKRLIIPNTRLLDGVIKVFVKTGPTHGDIECNLDKNVEVDLVMPGAKGTPAQLSAHRALHKISVAGQPKEFYGLDLLYMMKTKLRHCSTRTFQRDIEDIIYMLNTYTSEIEAIRIRLDKDDLEFFLSTKFITEEPGNERARFKAILGC